MMKELTVGDQRLAFVCSVIDDSLSIAAACRHFGISRVTGYKLLSRYHEFGVEGLNDRSRAPHHCPQSINSDCIDRILALKTTHPSWGPKKLRAFLARIEPDALLPATSTFGDILKRNGLVKPRRRHAGMGNLQSKLALTQAAECNHVWCIDYKGQFKLGDGQWCFALTITDDSTRFLIRCQALGDTRSIHAWPCFVGAFREFGMPQIIRSDNGSPFASNSLVGLTPLSLQFLKLGISHERMQPAKPTQNARHERMHKTLKAETTKPASAQMNAQQTRFDTWRHCYNNERPHEGIAMHTPSDLYTPSTRQFPAVMPAFEYPDGVRKAKVRPNGCIRWHGAELFVSETIIGENVGLDHFDERLYALYVGTLPIAVLDESTKTFMPRKQAVDKLREIRQAHKV